MLIQTLQPKLLGLFTHALTIKRKQRIERILQTSICLHGG
ncbi:hypothetical protein MED222_05080 [Vibrio sp. MED222]|nr:hypothetical protein MED222_05080 [Vibrio sp. MED222]